MNKNTPSYEELQQQILELESKLNTLTRTNYWKTTFDSIDDILFVVNENLEIEQVNNAVLKSTGKTKDEIIGKKCYEIFHNQNTPIPECPLLLSKQTKQTHYTEFFEKHSKKHYLLKCSPVLDEHGKIIKYVDLMIDITVEKELNQELRKQIEISSSLNEELNASNEELAAYNEEINVANEELKTTINQLEEAKDSYQKAMFASKDGVFDWNLITNEIYYSPAWKSMLGYADNELPNNFSTWETLTHPDDIKASWEALNKHITGETERFEMEFKMRHKKGHWVHILARANATFDSNNKAVRVVGTHVDITQRKLIEKQLYESENRFRSYIENAPNGIFITDNKGYYVEVNKAAEINTGYSQKELVGKHILDIILELQLNFGQK